MEQIKCSGISTGLDGEDATGEGLGEETATFAGTATTLGGGGGSSIEEPESRSSSAVSKFPEAFC